MSPKLKSALNLALKIAVAAGLIYYLVHSGHLDLKAVWELMTFRNVLLAVGLAGINVVLSAWRWIVLLKARGLHIPFGYGMSLYLIGMFFNYALPGSVSGDLVRGYYLVQDYPERKMDSALSVLIDRILGLYSFFIITLFAVAFDYDFVMNHEKIRAVAMVCLFLFLGITAFFILAFSSKLYRATRLDFIISKIPPIHRVLEGFQRFGEKPQILLASIGVSLVAQIFTMIYFYGLGWLIAEPGFTWQAVLFAVPMGFLVTAIPISPAGVGVGQVAFLYLFEAYLGHPTQFGAISITGFQLSLAVWALVGVVFYLRRRKPHELDNLKTKMEPTTP